MTVDFNKLTRKDLDGLPLLPFSSDWLYYRSIILLPKKKLHSSGFSWFAIIGENKSGELIKHGCCDSFLPYDQTNKELICFDCLAKSKCMRIFTYKNHYWFKVTPSLETIYYQIVERED